MLRTQKVCLLLFKFLYWNGLMQELGELRRKIEVLQGIKEGIIEVRKARKEKRKLQTLTDFLNAC